MAWGEGELQLTSQERKRLHRISRSDHDSARARLRASIILMSAEGLGANRIAKVTGIGKRTVRDARRRWRRRGFEGLEDAARSGRPAQANARYLRLLKRAVRTDPRKMGYAFTRWTTPRLAEYMCRRTGVRLSADWVRGLLKGQGFVWRKTKLTIRNLQSRRGKKGGAETTLEAPGGSQTAGS